MYSVGSVDAVQAAAEHALGRGDVDRALRVVHDFVERVVTEPLCAAQVFASRALDAVCQRIGRFTLARGGVVPVDPWPGSAGRARIVYVLTRLQNSGGHLRVVLDFIRARPECEHLILATGIAGPSDQAHLARALDGQAHVEFLAAPRGGFASRLRWLQGALCGCRAEQVYLFNHHQDSVAVAAIQPEMGLRAAFYHHGDHHLCLGVHLAHVTHIDPHPMGYHLCRAELGVDNVYLPFWFEDLGARTGAVSAGPLTTATAARSNKVEIPYPYSYLDVIPRVLQVTGGRHVHMGHLTPWALRRLRRGMREAGVPQDRLIYLRWTPSVWKCLLEYGVDLYLASFPYGGGITLVEAMGAGVPVILHQHMYSRVLSCMELAYPGGRSWGRPDELLAQLAELDRTALRAEGERARRHYEIHHHPEMARHLRDPASAGLSVPASLSEFRPQLDQWAAWTLRQTGWGPTARRALYRLLRRCRARLG